MGALLDDGAGAHVQDQIGVHDGAQAMRDHKAGAPVHERLHRLHDVALRARIHARRRLIQNEDRRVTQNHACDGEQLTLALADGLGIVFDMRVVALRHRADEVVHMRHLGRANDFLASGIGAAIGDVLGDRPVEQPCILQHHAKVRAQVRASHRMGVHTVELDRAPADFVKTHKQIDERGLAGAGGTHDGDLLPGFHMERHIAHKRLFRIVSKAHTAKVHAPFHGGGKPRGDLGQRVGLDLLFVENVEHALDAGKRVLQRVDGEGQLRERLGCLVDVLEERLEHADGDLAAHEHAARHYGNQHLGQADDETDQRADGIGGKVRATAGTSELVRQLVHPLRARPLAVEALDDEAPRVGLLHRRGELAHITLALGGELERPLGHALGNEGRHKGEHQEDRREQHTVAKHHVERADDRAHRAHELEQTGLQHLGHLVQVVRGTAHHLTGFVTVVELQRQAAELLGDAPAQRKVELLGKARHDEALHGVQRAGARPNAEIGSEFATTGLPIHREGAALGKSGLDIGP